MRSAGLALVLTLGLAACAGSPNDGRVTLTDGSTARIWGDGDYGLVLVHDAGTDAAAWEPQAVVFADEGMTVLAVEVTEPGAIEAAIGHLRDESGIERVALLAAGEGSEPAFAVGRQRPELVDQLIVISAASSETADLGPFPKLFVASAEEAAAAEVERMADDAPGDWNDIYLAAGAASGQAVFDGDGGAATLEAVLQRLAERR
ncbi:MAG TPA: alpha/beta hydrolase [Candidatus Dormibacteraeota bacterium]|nr:alpha/beta hydrolase [Candidatus Dormibacteraeota bacterium]